VLVQQNKLYGYDIPVAQCPAPPSGGFTSAGHFQKYSLAVLKCQRAAWAPVLQRMGVNLPAVKVSFINGAIKTPCGVVGHETSFYCFDGRSGHYIFVHMSLLKQSNEWFRLRAFETLSHEYFHHVQRATGIFMASIRLGQNGLDVNEMSRRLELQTFCTAMRIVSATKANAFTRQDYDIIVEWSSHDQDAQHGSAASNTYWWQRGLYMTKAAGCNTWTVNYAYVA